MINKIINRFRTPGYLYIDDFIKKNDDIMAIMAMGTFMVINLIGMIIRYLYPSPLIVGKEMIQVLLLISLSIGMYRTYTKKSKKYRFIFIAFGLSILNQFIFPASEYIFGYIGLTITVSFFLLLMTFLYRLEDHPMYYFLVSLGTLIAYEILLYQPEKNFEVQEIRIMMIFFLVIVFLISSLIKARYYQIMNYIYRLMYRDSETGLLNRLQLMHDLEVLKENNEGFFLLAIEFTSIDAMNKSYNYLSVVKMYKDIFRLLREKFHLKFYRIGNDLLGFIVKNQGDVELILPEITSILNRKHLIDDEYITLKFRVLGTNSEDFHNESISLIHNIYQVKHSKISQVSTLSTSKILWYDEDTFKKNERLKIIERDILKAITNGDFEIYIQPKVSLKEPDFYSGEVLSRWNHPELGFISPYEFIPVIEQKGLMVDFTAYILKMSHSFIKTFNGEVNRQISLAVNISSSVFRSNKIEEMVKEYIDSDNLGNFELEITEDVIFEMNENYLETIKRLQRLKLSLALDDFGTGFSNFEYLQDLNINTLKIDKKFIDYLCKDKRSRLLVKAMIDMAHALEMTVVAEGVEEEEQLKVLKMLNCDEVQGYYYSKPLSEEDFIAYYKAILN